MCTVKYNIYRIKLLQCSLTVLLLLSAFFINASSFTQTEEFYKNNDRTTVDTLKQLITLSEEYWLINKKLSDSLITEAFIIISKNTPSDSTLLADAYHMLGKVLIHNRKSENGIDTLKKSIFIRQSIIENDPRLIAETLNYIGIGFLGLQEFDSTIYYCNESKQVLINNKIQDINLYNNYINIGISYASLGEYNTSINYFDTALLTLNKNEDVLDSFALARYYNNYAHITTLTGKLKEANLYFEKAEDIFSKKFGGSHISLAGINTNKGNNSYYNYEFSKAELYYKKALDIYVANNANIEGLPRIYSNLSQVSQNMNDYLASINYCLLGLNYSPGNDLKLILNKNIAKSYAAIGNNDSANFYFKIALNLLQKENINPKRKQELYSSYGDFLLLTKSSASLIYYKKALESVYMLSEEDPDRYAEILSQIGTYFLEKEQNADSAIYYFKQAISIFNNNSNKIEVANINIVLNKKAHIGYASALLLKYHQPKDIELLYEADTIFTQVLNKMDEVSNSLGHNDKLLLNELSNPVFNMAIENSAKLFQITGNNIYTNKIFNYAERSKSSSLLSAVNTENALRTSDIPDKLFKYEHKLKDKINGLQQLLENEKTKNKPNYVNTKFFESELLALINKHDSLILDIEHNYPKYYSVKYGTKVISPEQIKQNLENDEAIIEYQLTDSAIFIITGTKDDFYFNRIPIDSNFYFSLNYIISIKNVDFNTQTNKRFNDFIYHSHNLWKTLIEPTVSSLDDKRLIIIPDGKLSYLPFDLLVEYNVMTDNINYRDLPYIIKKYPISYSYSTSLKFNTYFNLKKKNAKNSILAFAPSYNTNSILETNNSQLTPLPFAKDEAVNIVTNQCGDIYIDDNATKNNFLAEANTYNILHLAMHTLINDSLPMQSKLVFYNDETDSSSNYMFTHEIFNLNMVASMVVLSACNTASGNYKKGEGIMSLARGFVYAGIPSIIMTLWEVQDASGSAIMNKYYDYLNDGTTKDVALQQAKLDVLKNSNMVKSHPFFWSTYIISGDTSTIKVSNNNYNYYYWLVPFLILLLVFLYFYRSKLMSSINKSVVEK